MATLFHVLQFFDDAGEPLSGGKVYWDAAGTSTAKTVWKDQAETAAHTYPIILDGAGRPPNGAIFIRGSYKLTIKNSTETTTYATIDYINEYNQYDFTGLNASVGDLNSTKTVALNVNTTFTTQLSHRGATLLCDAISASFNVNLLAAVTALNTYKIIIKKVDVSNNIITIIPNGSERIDTDIDFVLYDFNDFVELHCDGSNWKIVASQIRGTIITQSTAKTLTLGNNGQTFNCDASGAGFDLNLPDARVVGRGYRNIFKKIDSSVNPIRFVASGSQTIEGQSTYYLYGYGDTVEIKTNGLNWFIINESGSTESFSTGDVKTSYNLSQSGWVQMNDGSIGNALSGATTRANEDTKALFILLYNSVPDSGCPVSGGRVAGALGDFNANKNLTIPKALGRVLINAGSAMPPYSMTLGYPFGNYQHTSTTNEMARHFHSVDIESSTPPTIPKIYLTEYVLMDDRNIYRTFWAGSSDPFDIVLPVTTIYYFIKL